MGVRAKINGEWVEVPSNPTEPMLAHVEAAEYQECGGCSKKAQAKRALVTLNIGGVLTPKSRESFQHAARKWGVKFVEITQPFRAVGGRPHWQKTFIADWAVKAGFEKVIYYDADILIRSDCPNVFELVPPGEIGVCSNDQIDGVLWKPGVQNRYHGALAWWAHHLGMTTPPIHEHANSGMIVFEPKTHAGIFEAWRQAGESVGWGAPAKLIDQAAFSVLLQNEKVCWLPMMFNSLIYRHELIRSAGQMQTFVYHYTGHRKDKLHEAEWRVSEGDAPRTAKVNTLTPSRKLLGTDVDLSRMFDRAVCLNLDRRHDRWTQFQRGLPRPWPFAAVQPVRAIDVRTCPAPAWFTKEAGQWGCLRSHLRAIEDALNDGVESLLVFEDDAEFRPGFIDHAKRFFSAVPNDWQLLFLGGSHTKGRRRAINDFAEIPGYVTLAHAYCMRREGMERFYRFAHEHTPGRPEIDHRLGEFSERGEVPTYAPREWLVWQSAGYSDLRERHRPRRGVVRHDAAEVG